MYMHYNHCHRVTTQLQLTNIIIIIIRLTIIKVKIKTNMLCAVQDLLLHNWFSD